VSNINEEAVNTLTTFIISAIKQILSTYQFPVLLSGRITEIRNNKYHVLINGNEYKISFKGDPTFSINDIVDILTIQNNYNRMVILNTERSSSESTTSDISN